MLSFLTGCEQQRRTSIQATCNRTPGMSCCAGPGRAVLHSPFQLCSILLCFLLYCLQVQYCSLACRTADASCPGDHTPWDNAIPSVHLCDTGRVSSCCTACRCSTAPWAAAVLHSFFPCNPVFNYAVFMLHCLQVQYCSLACRSAAQSLRL
jgi:hypothetical protein